MDASSRRGSVVAVCLSAQPGVPKYAVDGVELIAGFGVAGDYHAGERIDHVDGMTIEESCHMMATRLYQNTARVHFNQHLEKDGRFGRPFHPIRPQAADVRVSAHHDPETGGKRADLPDGLRTVEVQEIRILALLHRRHRHERGQVFPQGHRPGSGPAMSSNPRVARSRALSIR